MRSIAVLFVCSLAACDGSPTAPAARPLLVSAIVSPATFQAGASVRVQITVTNRGSQTRSVDAYQGPCGLAYDVLTSDGADTYLGEQVLCTQPGFDPQPVAPGASYTVTQWWSTSDLPLPAGQYLVRGALAGVDIEDVPMTVTITP